MFGRYKKSFLLHRGVKNRKLFINSLPEIIAKIPGKKAEIDMISMSGKKYFTDQLFSLLSFYYNVGIPVSWTIFDDGSYTHRETDIFLQIPGVIIKQINPEGYAELTSRFPTLKKMLVLKRIIPRRATMFTDSDVLFFSPFQNSIQPYLKNNCYLVDENRGYFDDFIPSEISRMHPLNLGVLLLNSIPHWDIAFDYIEERIKNNELAYWTDQTATHIMAQKEEFTPLPENKFVTGGKDAFSLRDAVDYKKIALRHFVGPIRHKMWQHHWKKVLLN